MTNVEFCYWLQGSLEVMQNQFFDVKKVQTIKAHLDMVELYDTTMQTKASVYRSFCDWLRGYLEGADAMNKGVDMTRITNYLFQLFDHVVPAIQPELSWSEVSPPRPKMQLNSDETSELVRC